MAKKYIDAELLCAEIERRKEEYKKDRYMSDYRGQIAYYKDKIYDDLLSFINSLQQEQPCETCTNDKGCVTCKDGELWEGKEVNLEKEECELVTADEDIITIHLGKVLTEKQYDAVLHSVIDHLNKHWWHILRWSA